MANTYKDKYWQTMENLAFIITQMSSLLAFFDEPRIIPISEWMINDFLYLVNFSTFSLFRLLMLDKVLEASIVNDDDGCSMKPLIIFML